MSPRAALRLEHLGFTDVYDYVPGKSDWTAAGLPREGESAGIPNAGDVVHGGVPTCYFRDSLADARQAMDKDGRGFCVATDEDNVVLGMLYREDQAEEGATVENAMHPGPTTIRANEPLGPLIERMEHARVDAILVTDPEGRLLGLLDRHAAKQALKQATA